MKEIVIITRLGMKRQNGDSFCFKSLMTIFSNQQDEHTLIQIGQINSLFCSLLSEEANVHIDVRSHRFTHTHSNTYIHTCTYMHPPTHRHKHT